MRRWVSFRLSLSLTNMEKHLLLVAWDHFKENIGHLGFPTTSEVAGHLGKLLSATTFGPWICFPTSKKPTSFRRFNMRPGFDSQPYH